VLDPNPAVPCPGGLGSAFDSGDQGKDQLLVEGPGYLADELHLAGEPDRLQLGTELTRQPSAFAHLVIEEDDLGLDTQTELRELDEHVGRCAGPSNAWLQSYGSTCLPGEHRQFQQEHRVAAGLLTQIALQACAQWDPARDLVRQCQRACHRKELSEGHGVLRRLAKLWWQ
jgi:hypothetical protein